jgi:microcystin-dependent protein
VAQPYVGEIRMFAGNFAPAGWSFCEGQLLPISENETLFQLIGTTYGGDGQSTFALPDLRGRLPLHFGSGGGGSYAFAEMAGVEEVTLTTQQMPVHNHPYLANGAAGADTNPANNVVAGSPNISLFREASLGATMAPTGIGPVGGNQPHTNFQPYLCVDFIVSLFGIFPSQT